MITTETSGVTTTTSGPRLVQLKDICDRITKGSTPTSYGFKYTKEGIRFIKTENIDKNGLASTTTDYIDEATNEFLKRSILQEHDILFSIAGTIGRVGIIRRADLPANTNQALAIVRLQPGIIEQRYLFYYLKSDAIQKYALKRIVGVGRANLSLTNIGGFAIPLISLDQQKQIIAEIEKQFSRLDEAIANLKRVKANLKRYKASVLKAAVEGKLTEDWRKQHPNVEPASKLLERILSERRAKWIGMGSYGEPAELDISKLTKLPEGWIWCSLDHVSFGYQNGLSKRKADRGVPTRVLRLADVVNGKISSAFPREIPLSKEELDKYLLKEGELVCIRVNGSRDLVGRLVCVEAPGKWAYCDHFIRIHLVGGLVSPKYVVHVFETKGTRAHFERSMVSTAGQHTVNQQALKATAIPFPPLAEQNQIVAEVERRLSIIEELETAVEANLTRAARLRQSILQRAFRGELHIENKSHV